MDSRMEAVYISSGLKAQVEKAQSGNMDVMGLAVAAASFVVAGIVVATGLVVLANYQNSLTAGSAAANATGKAIEGVGNLANQMPTIGLAIAAAAVIGIIFGAFAYLLYKKAE